MTLHDAHCAFHLGDNLTALRLIYHLAKLHPDHVWRFAVHRCHLLELTPLVEDTPNITLCDIEVFGIQPGSVDCWKQSESFWSEHPLKNDYAAFTKRYYRRLTRKFGLQDAIPDLLFDFEYLIPNVVAIPETKILLVNSNPQSGQFLDYTRENSLDEMAFALNEKHRIITTKPVAGIPCTRNSQLLCADIGRMSYHFNAVIGVATGPLWLTMNKWSRLKYRLIMCQNEHVNLCAGTVWARSISQAMDELKLANLI